MDDDDIWFDAETGLPIGQADNVIPFPRRFTKPVLVSDDYVEAVTIKSTASSSAVDDLARRELADLDARMVDDDDL